MAQGLRGNAAAPERAEGGGIGTVLASVSAGMAVIVVAGVSGVVAGAWLLNW